MFKRTFSLIFCIWLTYNPTHPNDAFDPSDHKYCDLSCPIPGGLLRPSACNCTTGFYHTDILDEIVSFRKQVLRKHNDWRDFIASGTETKKNWSEAANMMALNYDLELEYMARCFAGVFEKDREPCRTSQTFSRYGQNIGGKNAKLNLEGSIGLISGWYNEIDNLDGDEAKKKDFVTVYPRDHIRPVGQFTQMIWADELYVGCARVWYPENTNAFWRFALICNYAGSAKGSNLPGSSVYEVGEKCSKCPEGTKCNIEAGGVFTGLCGIIKPVPEALPIPIPKAEEPPSPKPAETTTTTVGTTKVTKPSGVAAILSCEKRLISFFVLVLLLGIDV